MYHSYKRFDINKIVAKLIPCNSDTKLLYMNNINFNDMYSLKDLISRISAKLNPISLYHAKLNK